MLNATLLLPVRVAYIGVQPNFPAKLFALLQQNIGNSSTRFRYFDGFDIMMEGGGREIEEYLITQQANSGITGAEVVTTYTNVMPEGSGFGLVSGKNRFTMLNIRVDPKTIEYMKNDPLTLLNFK